MNITISRTHKFYAANLALWIVVLISGVVIAYGFGRDLDRMIPLAVAAMLPAIFSTALLPFMRKEWAQIIIILLWLSLPILACLIMGLIPFAILFVIAPAAAAYFDRSKIIEAACLGALSAALIYYIGTREDLGFLKLNVTEDIMVWLQGISWVATVLFLIVTFYSLSTLATHTYEPPNKSDSDLLDALPGGVFRINANNFLSFATDSAHSMFKMPQDKTHGYHVSALFDNEESQIEFMNMINQSRLKQTSISKTFQINKAPNEQSVFDVTVAPIDTDNLVIYVSDRDQDVKQLNALADRLSKAENEAENKTLFFAGVSHELRTPLNAIIGFSDMMRSRIFGPLQGKYAEYADMIHDSGQHMLDLIGDVLDMSKIEAGKYELHYDNFDAIDLIRSSMKMVRPMAEAGQVKLKSNLTEDMAEMLIEADRKAMRQMLLNVLSNAVKFSPKDETVTLDAFAEEGMLIVEISDNGPGISAEDLKQIGQPYNQTTSSQTIEARGSGLGLTVVKSLIELHKGRFEIDSHEGEGTKVALYVPMQRA